jgi:RimJ/RimL family protein N-acetyltransferase
VTLSKATMLGSLPIVEVPFVIRLCERSDWDKLAAWPDYPHPFARLNASERDLLFQDRKCQDDRITLILDHADDTAIGYLALLEIDWGQGIAGNMSVRMHPERCGRGLGTFMLRKTAEWCFGNGIETLRLDVAASNLRAVQCYEKVGFAKTGEFWRKVDELKGVDPNEEQYAFLRNHIRLYPDTAEMRFWWMELRKKVVSQA